MNEVNESIDFVISNFFIVDFLGELEVLIDKNRVPREKKKSVAPPRWSTACWVLWMFIQILPPQLRSFPFKLDTYSFADIHELLSKALKKASEWLQGESNLFYIFLF
jgi:hypothetical protein